MQTDLTFFTNEPGATLLDRFRKTLKDVHSVRERYSQTKYTVNATNNNLRNAAGGRRVAVFSNGVKYFDILVGFFRTGAETLVSGAEFGSCEKCLN